MARPIKATLMQICDTYRSAKSQGIRFPCSHTAKILQVSTRTVQRGLLKGVQCGYLQESMLADPVIKPKYEPPKTELTWAWT